MHSEMDATWVPAAVASDILEGSVVPATLPSGPIAIWRSASGRLYANGDRCPHRGMRLSHGFVRGETLSCIYHGWRYGTDGSCQLIPAHPNVTPPKTINCGPLSVQERNGVVYVAKALPADGPMDFAGYDALRSLTMNAPQNDIVRAAQGIATDGAIAVQLAQTSALLLMNETGPKEALVIALVDRRLSVIDQLAVSAALEALRRASESTKVAA